MRVEINPPRDRQAFESELLKILSKKSIKKI